MHAAKTFALVLCLLVASWHIAAAQGANLMANEGSPYLRQHKDDLVHWMPWGDAAFERAKLEDKPVFLSIGYSTCYWCHVMRRESFTDPDTAKLINDNFVAVLVDRERRPDVDETYALVTQLISGVGGWPTNAFLTPDRKPFYATVYVPQDILYQTLEVARDRWANNRADMEAEAEQLSGIIHRYLNRREAAVELTPDKLHEASAVSKVLEKAKPLAKPPTMAGSSAAPSSCARRYFCSSCAKRKRTRPAMRSRRSRQPCAACSTVASTIMSAAASTAMRRMQRGGCPTSRRCSMTRR